MPLVRAEVRNEYALGAPELYREARKEDPKEVLEGVAVAGLVGVLRQLGDLAEFAAEVFHGLQEEVTRTSSRSHKLMGRVQRIEAALSPLEKALLAQRSHLHFAYTAGSNWHTRIRGEQNHFIYSDLPPFIMDAYEDCRRPPSLHLLDKFDPGGPGSCLKRYSDPTFFKRASVASGEASSDKILKDKKGRKIKKRRSWPRNGKVSRDASFSHNSGRMKFTQLNIGGHTSPSQTASTYDASTLRSDLGEQSNLDLRNGSTYIEGDFRPSYSVEPEEQESRESISSVKRHESDFLDYNFLEGKIADALDDIPINIPHEQAGCGSSSVTLDEQREAPEPINVSQEQARCSSSSVSWDVKRGTLGPSPQGSDNGMTEEGNYNRRVESFSPSLNLEPPSGNGLDFGTFDKMDIQLLDQAVQDPKFGDVHLDDIESEADHFMDALNTIESECETDIDCTKKVEAENCSNLEEKGVENGVSEAIRHHSECQSSSSESNVLASGPLINGSRGHNPISVSPKSPYVTNCFINGVAAKDEFDSVSLVNKDFQSSQRAGDSVSPSSPQSIKSHDNGSTDAANYVRSVSSTTPSDFRGDRPGIPITDGTRNSSDTHKKEPEASNVTSVTFWTNGGLLGLQPSKPPDCSVLNALSQDPEYNDGKINPPIKNFTRSDTDSGKRDQTESLKNIEEDLDVNSSKYHEYQESGASYRKTSWKISPADLDINLGKLVSTLNQNAANSTGSNVRGSGSFLPVNPPFEADRRHKENCRSSSQMFEINNRLVSTESNKRLLPGGDGNTYNAEYRNVNASEQKNRPSGVYRSFSGRSKDLFGGESSILSPSSSPPLQHMKISFQPIDGFESLKLKLKFPDRNTNNENGLDIFPSFQLVPEVSIARYNVGLDSDADTFYRSSPSLSDDCHSNQSESNSEQWESSESPTSKDRDLYDALRRISLMESVSTVPENGRTNHIDIHGSFGLQFPFPENGVQYSESCRSFDLQSLGTLNHAFRKEIINDTNLKDLLEPQLAATPVPPPLPPVQWRGSTQDKCGPMTEGSSYAADPTRLASTISQPKPAPFSEDQIDTTNMQISKIPSSQKSNGPREANQGKNMDETDFLHQIRTKSFNLRPIGTTKPTVPSGASPTVQVTAILEKANAIRQAVGSDGEDDGTWSDT